MPTVIIDGTSDDIINVSGIAGEDQFYVPLRHHKGPYMCSLLIGGQMRIHALYDGCWSFAVGQADEDTPLPDWPVHVRPSGEVHYSTQLEIDVPEGTTFVREW